MTKIDKAIDVSAIIILVVTAGMTLANWGYTIAEYTTITVCISAVYALRLARNIVQEKKIVWWMLEALYMAYLICTVACVMTSALSDTSAIFAITDGATLLGGIFIAGTILMETRQNKG